jgi:hypothetical protein
VRVEDRSIPRLPARTPGGELPGLAGGNLALRAGKSPAAVGILGPAPPILPLKIVRRITIGGATVPDRQRVTGGWILPILQNPEFFSIGSFFSIKLE